MAAALLASPAPAATVRGHVLGFPGGEPLDGIQVLARDAQGASAAGVTDSEGAFLIDQADPGLVRVQARPSDDRNLLGAYAGDVSAFCAAEVFELAADGVLDGIVIELPEGGVIEGVLRDGDGAPSAGEVAAQGADALNQSLLRRADAGGDGAFAVRGLASWVGGDGEVLPGAYRLSGRLPGEPAFYAPGTWHVSDAELVPAVRGQVTPVELTRPVGADLLGRVVDPAGDGVMAEIAVSAAGFGVVWTGSSESDGSWQATNLPGPGLTVRVRAEGFAETWAGGGAGASEAAAFPAGELTDVGEIALLPARPLRIALLAAPPPTGSALITLARPDGAPLRVTSMAIEDGGIEVDDAPPGALLVTAQVPGMLTARGEVDANQGTLELALEPASSLAARVWDRASGLPVRGAVIDALLPGGEAPIASARTDGDGLAELGGLPSDDILLRASWQPFCPGEPARVTVWSGAARGEGTASLVPSEGGGEVPFALPPDRDRDAMDDVWELLWGLDPGRPDGGEDPDADGVINVDEYRGHTDPLGADPQIGCSLSETNPTCAASRSALLLLVLLSGFVRRHRDR